MTLRRTIVCAALGALALVGCGGRGGAGDETPRDEVTIYSSLPLQGAQRTLAEAIQNGTRLALDEAGHRAGRFRVRYRALDDSTAQMGSWDPGQTSANARRAAADPTTIAYIGEFNSGASAISIPILNQARVPQVSPGNTAVGLTADEPGAEAGEPGKYYPTGERTYVRIVPKDTVQGAALASLMREEGCARAFVLHDRELYGAGLARNVQHAADDLGLEVLGSRAMDPRAQGYRALAARLGRRRVDCVAFAGITPNNAVQLFEDLAGGLPRAKLFGTDGVAESSFANPREGGLPAGVARRTLLTAPTLAPSNYPAGGRRFFRAYAREYGQAPDPWAIYGYESMRLVLDAITSAGSRGNDKASLLRTLRGTRDRRSVLGTYGIDRNGDTTLTDYGVYRIAAGRLRFDRRVRPPRPRS